MSLRVERQRTRPEGVSNSRATAAHGAGTDCAQPDRPCRCREHLRSSASVRSLKLAPNDRCWWQDHGIFLRFQTAPWKYSYMLGGMFSSCAFAMCFRTISEYKKRSPQMRQCHWSRAKMYGRHSELFGSSLGSGILIISRRRETRIVLNRGVGRPSRCLQPDQDSNGERSTAMGFPGQRSRTMFPLPSSRTPLASSDAG
jgi:hypothetical protein